MGKLLQAYDNQDKYELAKQMEDEIFEGHQRKLIETLKGTLYLQKQSYGLLKFNIKDVMTDFKLEMGFKGQWAVVPCDEKKKSVRHSSNQSKAKITGLFTWIWIYLYQVCQLVFRIHAWLAITFILVSPTIVFAQRKN